MDYSSSSADSYVGEVVKIPPKNQNSGNREKSALSSTANSFEPHIRDSSPEVLISEKPDSASINDPIDVIPTSYVFPEEENSEIHKRKDLPRLSKGQVCTPSTSSESSVPAAKSHLPPVSPSKRQTPVKTTAVTPKKYSSAAATPVSIYQSPAKKSSLNGSPIMSPSKRVSRLASIADGSSVDLTVPSYQRSYSLTSTSPQKRRPSTKDVTIQRFIPTSHSQDWGSNVKGSYTAPKEALPMIELHEKTKYDYLTAGEQLTSYSPSKTRSQRVSTVVIKEERADAEEEEKDAVVVTKVRRMSATAVQSTDVQIRPIRRLLDTTDFQKAKEEAETEQEGEAYNNAYDLFSRLAHTKDKMQVEDFLEVLRTFTPPGVAAQEASDFLWFECDHKIALSFEDFLLYAPKMRTRIYSYENFSTFTDEEKFVSMYVRLFPYKPVVAWDSARRQIVKAEKHLRQNPATSPFRPLRVYEHSFLVSYQKRLLQQGLIDAGEVPPDLSPTGEFDVTQRIRRKTANNTDEAVEWGESPPKVLQEASTQTVSKKGVRGITESDLTSPLPEEGVYPSLAKCNTGSGKKRHPSRKAKAGATPPAAKVSHRELFPGSISPSKRNGPGPRSSSKKRYPSSSRGKKPFETNANRPSPTKRKIVGTNLDEEYEHRRQQDANFIRLLHDSYQ
ncbi:hypothetical protein ADEAN_000549400 [Angomonas deanei]|uniref:EF-hand domain-containing protein n=1 Tax=Angomonas deanei TaxID=59799 RepID=A0A7G2CDT5_9TRYP|nr:hypothetical protein ADEAN_000549400 [Angomonas deanei]